VADHLSRLQFEEPINDYMRDDTLLKVSTTDLWYTNIVNYIVAGYIPPRADKKKIIRDSRLHIWDDPYLYRVCVDGLLGRCIPSFETWKILEHCHSSQFPIVQNTSCWKIHAAGRHGRYKLLGEILSKERKKGDNNFL
jgi:hypothetical protein